MKNFYKKPEYITNLAKKLRRNQTRSEEVLWKRLRWKKLNWLRFHRQKPLFVFNDYNWWDRFYIADFYNRQNNLIIELDWKIHDQKDQKEYDDLRNKLLENWWCKILRFKNKEVFENLDFILEKIVENTK